MWSAYETLILRDESPVITATMAEIRQAVDPQRALLDIVNYAVSDHTLLRVAGLLDAHGFDLSSVRLEASTIKDSRLTKILPGIDISDGVSASDLRDRLIEHRLMLYDLVSALGRRHPRGFVVAYGLGLALSYPEVMDRQSSDLDIFLPMDDSHVEILRTIVREFGYSVEGVSVGSGAGSELVGWKLAVRRDGHNLTIDGFAGGRPSSGHQWIPPFELPHLFSRARRIELPMGGTALVPCPEDYLVMLAEKIQRKGDYSLRRVRDALTVVDAESSIDWAQVCADCSYLHVGLGLGWLLDRVEDLRPGCTKGAAEDRFKMSGWERRFQAVMSGETGASIAGRRRARSVHRRVWVTRYVLTHQTKAAALIEIGNGRYRRKMPDVPVLFDLAP